MTSFRKKGKRLREDVKEIALHVINVCDEEARTGTVQFCIKQRIKRICNYTGLGKVTINKVRKEPILAGDSKLPTPCKRYCRPFSTIAHIDYFGLHVIRSTIKDFYLLQDFQLNKRKLLAEIKKKVEFPWGEKTFLRLLKRIGYKWRRCRKQTTRALIEHPDSITCRFRYLKSIRKFREENMNIIYVGETCIDNSLCCKMYCLVRDSIWSQANVSPSNNKLIVLHATGTAGFVEDCLLIYKAGQPLEGYEQIVSDGQMNCKNFEKWLTEVLLPNIPERSVIVLDSFLLNSVELNRPPTEYATKAAMRLWLEKNNIAFCHDMYKVELYNLIKKYKSNEKLYYIDEFLKNKGHTVLRLPPYTFELNPAEFAWDKVENKIRQKNLAASSRVDELEMAVVEGIKSITRTDWNRFYSNVIKIENDYWDTDEALDTKMETYTVNICLDSDDSVTDSESEMAVLS